MKMKNKEFIYELSLSWLLLLWIWSIFLLLLSSESSSLELSSENLIVLIIENAIANRKETISMQFNFEHISGNRTLTHFMIDDY